MARSHQPNPDFDNHCKVTESAVANYQRLFNQQESQVTIGGKPYRANLFYSGKDEGKLVGFLRGEFFLGSAPTVHVSIIKKMSLTKKRGKFESKTKIYSYNISFEHESIAHIIRWDNAGDGRGEKHHGFSTAHHLHIEADNKAKKPHPVHGDGNFPYVSDVFKLVEKMILDGVPNYHAKLREAFEKIPRKKRNTPSEWTCLLDKAIEDNFFSDIYL